MTTDEGSLSARTKYGGNDGQSVRWEMAGLQHTHTSKTRRHMISGDIISNGVKSLDSRGPEGKTRMLSPGPATR